MTDFALRQYGFTPYVEGESPTNKFAERPRYAFRGERIMDGMDTLDQTLLSRLTQAPGPTREFRGIHGLLAGVSARGLGAPGGTGTGQTDGGGTGGKLTGGGTPTGGGSPPTTGASTTDANIQRWMGSISSLVQQGFDIAARQECVSRGGSWDGTSKSCQVRTLDPVTRNPITYDSSDVAPKSAETSTTTYVAIGVGAVAVLGVLYLVMRK
jgi:hypothetical protein